MKMKTFNTSALLYADKIDLVISEYEDGSMYLGLQTTNGELYSDISTNILKLPFPYFHVEVNSEAERFVIEQNIGISCKCIMGSGFKTYRLYEFIGME